MSSTGPSGEHTPLRVLIAEDDLSYARLLRGMLQGAAGAGFEVRCVERMTEAIGLLDGGWPNVLLLDLSLPDSRGLATVQLARRTAPDLAVVVMTGSNDLELAKEAFRAGVQDYVVKDDITPPLLLRCIRYALERKALELSHQETVLDLTALLTATAGPVFRLTRQGDFTLLGDPGAAPAPQARVQDLVPAPFAEALAAAVKAVLGGAPPVSVSGTIRSSEAIVSCTGLVTRRGPDDALVALTLAT